MNLNGGPLPISTLRGQHVDNKQWLEDPAAPAIIVGTIDMIGSRLLFEGYGVSRKMRPYQYSAMVGDLKIVDTYRILARRHAAFFACGGASGGIGGRPGCAFGGKPGS